LTVTASATRYNKIACCIRRSRASKDEISCGKHYGVNPCEAVPYQFVPSAIKLKMSIFPAVAVIVGAPTEDHFTPVNVAVPLPVAAACLSNKINDCPAVAVGIVNVQAVEAVSVAVWNVPLANEIVLELETVPIATTPSV
jgi:hypothetical protein